MKKSTIGLLVGVVLLLMVGGIFVGKYNSLVAKDESVQTAWSQVENQYQRRWDLIPNLVNTVKGYAAHENETLTQVVEARAKATSMNIDVKDAQALAQFQAAQSGISSALSRLMVVVERYPELKASQNFLELQAQLEGTENRISTERRRFNDTVKNYNVYVRSFPNNLLAGFFGFEKANLFEMQDTKMESAPEVAF